MVSLYRWGSWNYFGRIANGNTVSWNVFYNDRTRSDFHVVTNADFADDAYVSTYVNIVSYNGATAVRAICILFVTNSCIVPYSAIFADNCFVVYY